MRIREFVDYLQKEKLNNKRVFLSGAITSRMGTYREHFNNIAKELDAAGIKHYNPAEIDESTQWDVAMRATILELLNSDIIFMLKGWEVSKGANLESEIAEALNMPIFEED